MSGLFLAVVLCGQPGYAGPIVYVSPPEYRMVQPVYSYPVYSYPVYSYPTYYPLFPRLNYLLYGPRPMYWGYHYGGSRW